MSVQSRSRNWMASVVALSFLFVQQLCVADVAVSVVGNTATASIALPSVATPTYTATVTITFDSVVNLTADSLNLTATIVDPGSFTGLPSRVTLDPAFPVLISVEPPADLFLNSFEMNEAGNGNLDFLNTYLFEVHTGNLACTNPSSQYRLYKAPHGSTTFADVTSSLFSGSVRARGRGGAFSQFVIVKDARPELVPPILGLPVIAIDKLLQLTDRLLVSTLSTSLLNTLSDLLALVSSDLLLLDYGQASIDLGSFVSNVESEAGIGIANEWNADRTLSNDAGELVSLAETLQFTLNILQGQALCLAPPPG